MPFVNGAFQPRPLRRLAATLFDVMPPDHPDEDAPATADDRAWYEEITEATADLLMYVVLNVHDNYERWRGVSFDRRTVVGMYRLAGRIFQLLDNEVPVKAVAKDVNRTAKQFGLVVYSNEEGPRYNWPTARVITREQAVAVVQDAFWGRWPDESDIDITGTNDHNRRNDS